MIEVGFIYKGAKTVIQNNSNEKLKDIIQRFILKTELKKDELCFLYGGDKVKEELSFIEQASSVDKNTNKMEILATEIENQNQSKIENLKKSKYIICPKCKENIRINFQGNKITLYDCKNNHKIENISLNEFEKSQQIDESGIICQNCKNFDKNSTFNSKFFKCLSCHKNLCPLCSSNHDKSHNIINYDDINFVCESHSDSYTSYCQDCKNDICLLCEQKLNGHKLLSYGGIMPNIENLNCKMNDLKNKIDEYKKYINEITFELNEILGKIDNYYNIIGDIISNYEYKKGIFLFYKI